MNEEETQDQQIQNRTKGAFIYKGPLKSAIETARYYGFKLSPPLTITKRLPTTLTKAKREFLKEKDFSDFPKDYMSSLKKYIDDEMHKIPQPIMVCHVIDRPNNWSELRLEIMGTEKSVAEATIIKTASIILRDLGHRNILIKLNSIGDKESGNNFLKELMNYYREHINNLPPTIQQRLKKDILKIYANKSEKYKEINENAPKPISFLSEESRKHFKQIIEFLENMEIDYEINEDLVGASPCFPKNLYEILEKNKDGKEKILAKGERYNYLAQNIGFNKKVPIVGIGINIKRKEKKKDSYVFKSTASSPKIYFIHLGFDAKKESLNILETFRKSKVPIYQSLCNDSFTHQLKNAESYHVPYTMIIGQKEVLEKTIIFRDMKTRYQENIELSNLETFLNRLKRKNVI
ncbi:MAG TPA: His/Gly/Thr/Pro-type tRNA ligase C-terminal domain-containing protein [Candidatus Paceibacterota bacterium]|jgi:histidyl-tRNA synthetase|nr:hypothetical protein [Parcubacteria group bacterium]MDP6119655.1 His/Gly/Thr/Pro-type tRNA ligase C-terminal domain-containing protein [Candidatus Paceibacterota bacterium]HJN62753.1 His/Gly/Thr/Pro-type tRNA ligase C-terminal domain-containing protein [Candidatus Paceibacterota bacterium]|tara:strand:- start:6437 stop:7654 length:1218 start_codon:yes stop_codon:yes gene_type:complete